MKSIKEYTGQIWHAVNCLYDCSGSMKITEISQNFPDDNSQLGLSEAIDAGIIVNEHGRIHLHPDVFFGLFTERMGVAF